MYHKLTDIVSDLDLYMMGVNKSTTLCNYRPIGNYHTQVFHNQRASRIKYTRVEQ